MHHGQSKPSRRVFRRSNGCVSLGVFFPQESEHTTIAERVGGVKTTNPRGPICYGVGWPRAIVRRSPEVLEPPLRLRRYQSMRRVLSCGSGYAVLELRAKKTPVSRDADSSRYTGFTTLRRAMGGTNPLDLRQRPRKSKERGLRQFSMTRTLTIAHFSSPALLHSLHNDTALWKREHRPQPHKQGRELRPQHQKHEHSA